jgi:hypothetical protein
MQDWEWEVADPARLDEFLDAYENAGLTEDERFVLMEMLIQSCEDLPDRDGDARWGRVLELLNRNVALHIATVWYWATPDDTAEFDGFGVGKDVRRVLEEHRGQFERSS